MAALFDLDGVSLRRAERQVLSEVTAEIPAGASCVAGPSGSGKSTLLRLLNRLADPDAGAVRYRGTDVRELDPLALRREVGLVPQLPALLAGSAGENVEFAARLAGREEVDVGEMLEAAGLDGSFAERDGSQLSVGEQQRVMLARALAQQPKVLLLDEPTSALDAAARDAVEATLASLRESFDLSLVLVTHDLEQARRMADWVVTMEEGRVVGQGQVAEVLAR
ncbi:MAG: UDP-glucose/iron transport system ATP-binding protein [Solirubrobacterales bacterium]|jgi:putative ABC transport system ATP-binding protein|nr:UDP-glucose/iron transport system ATP-binding protein [Solirubrobacterales bacterium]